MTIKTLARIVPFLSVGLVPVIAACDKEEDGGKTQEGTEVHDPATSSGSNSSSSSSSSGGSSTSSSSSGSSGASSTSSGSSGASSGSSGSQDAGTCTKKPAEALCEVGQECCSGVCTMSRCQ